MEFFFRQYGQGQTIIILHGWLGLSDHWISVAKYLSTQGFNTIVPDLPNHGRSFHTDSFSFDEMAEIMNSFSLTQGFENPILLAHSMGGKIAMKMVDKNPNYYKSLIIIDIHFKTYNKNPVRDLFISTLNQVEPSEFNDIRNFRAFLLNKGIEKDMLGVVLKNIEIKDKKLIWKSNMTMLTREAEKVLQEIEISETKIQTLIIRGENSNYIRDKDIITLKEKFKNSKIITAPKSGHLIHIDNPVFLIKEIINFIHKLS